MILDEISAMELFYVAFIENHSKYSIFKKDHLSPLNFQSCVSLCKVESF